MFRGSARVRLGDVDAAGHARLDALARWLQDVSGDDTADVRLPDAQWWVVRRTFLRIECLPVYGEDLELATFLGGTGRSWAERRVSVTGSRAGRVEAASLWVSLDPATGRPRRLPAGFHDVWGDAGGRRVSARLDHPARPEGAPARPWPLRRSDIDLLGHVNNAATWEIVDDEIARLAPAPDVAVATAELGWTREIAPGEEIRVASAALEGGGGGVGVWITSPAGTHASAVVTFA